uniref:chymotrypsin-2-like n=1 Tax=Anopheles coluzzii TaxID=1518534 RepID=UPI0020FFB0C7|nr:chymotrypsin-2-like [Anopheles coluzzii]
MMANFTKCVVLVIAAAVFQTSEVRSIVGGHASLPGAAPYIVAIKTTSASTLLCAGVLIKTTWILTTAQCVNDKTAADLKILTGSHRLLTSKELLLVSKIERHPSYKPASSEYNLALLQLSAAVSLSSRVATVVLNDEPIISGIPVVFFGWGASSYGSLAYSNVLQSLYKRTLSTSDCRAQSELVDLSADNICTIGQPGQAACTHDEAGPLVRYDTQKLVGLFNYGSQCTGRSPDVFVNVLTHKTWIDSIAI